MSSTDRILAISNRAAFGAADALGEPRISILIFHRVRPVADPLFADEMSAQYFERLMSMVARSFRVVTFGQALELIASGGSLPARLMVITFDDGYADNEEVALPILRKHGLVASFFVATGFLDGGRMWNDSVIESVRACRHETIDLADLGLGCYPLGTTLQRRSVIGDVLSAIKHLRPANRDDAVERLHRATAAGCLPRDLMMTSAQVRLLHQAGMEIGGHTVNHPILTSISPTEAEREITVGRERLQDLTDGAVDVMAYPNGLPLRDFGSEHVAMVKRLGFRGAVTTAPGTARIGDDPFQLPRFTPWDRSLVRWSARLLNNRLQRKPATANGVLRRA